MSGRRESVDRFRESFVGGYSSSLAAANLVRLGFSNVADLIGGHTAWAAAGLPTTQPDHSHLDTPRCDEPDFNQEL